MKNTQIPTFAFKSKSNYFFIKYLTFDLVLNSIHIVRLHNHELTIWKRKISVNLQNVGVANLRSSYCWFSWIFLFCLTSLFMESCLLLKIAVCILCRFVLVNILLVAIFNFNKRLLLTLFSPSFCKWIALQIEVLGKSIACVHLKNPLSNKMLGTIFQVATSLEQSILAEYHTPAWLTGVLSHSLPLVGHPSWVVTFTFL